MTQNHIYRSSRRLTADWMTTSNTCTSSTTKKRILEVSHVLQTRTGATRKQSEELTKEGLIKLAMNLELLYQTQRP